MAVTPQTEEAIFLVLSSLVHSLVDNGAIKIEQLQNSEAAFRMQADATHIEQKRANVSEAADLMAILAATARRQDDITRSHLRLVQSDDEDGDAR